MWSGLRSPTRSTRWTVFGARARQKLLAAAAARDGVGPVLVGVPYLDWWLDKFDWHARTASAPQLFDKSGCNNELGAKVAGTSVRSLSGGTGNSKGANGESHLVDPAPARGETQIGPREGLLPSGQAAGRWYFPPLLCADDMDAARPGLSGGHMPAYLQHFTRARGRRGMK
jgi:hypothetical protein